ncbi:hypothetical protein BpHYR1_039674 [Brachionus plicatilis]|uniref:Uncharacterized protein n=1 Tax=Brachionus plicatilis TaxID=10195 RepID=A0A3M7RCA2_BRAPC|nr:hypothetical protein BpHYR1_039674 [Brachionus plicatilis]
MNIPLERKRRPGRPKATTNALTRQPNETQNVDDLCISVFEKSDPDDPPNPNRYPTAPSLKKNAK